jgi:DNA-binding response OmpR family regulator
LAAFLRRLSRHAVTTVNGQAPKCRWTTRISPEQRTRLTGLRVLVVEDFDSLRELTRMMLEREGASVVEARSGREALDAARTERFDVALMDLGLPDVSGHAVIAGIRALSDERTAVIVVSGSGRRELSRAVALGAECSFTKPVDWDELLGYLTSAATRPRSPRTPGAREPNRSSTAPRTARQSRAADLG